MQSEGISEPIDQGNRDNVDFQTRRRFLVAERGDRSSRGQKEGPECDSDQCEWNAFAYA